ncbi:hypothetical protein L596_030346 [Steinernema carpocapsae]|uniref:Uncharacterized protein n=1 Tax=Steinernema carpocapsae TaxID=34508 RepID=A0A4V5ZWX0_STECR|nr:hypothetical protein L596_030346 [Steinernema carpocapsae]
MWNERLYAHLVCEMTTGKCISFCVFGAFLVACVVCDEMPNTFEEQQDPLFQQHFQQQQNLQQMLFPRGPYPAGYPNQFGHTFPQQLQGNSVNFDFQCKCTAKTPRNGASTTMPLPTDANAQAQQQIQQLQEQLRQQQDQMKRSQSQQPFEQFAHMLSVADGLDCSCSGSSMPLNDPVLGNNE